MQTGKVIRVIYHEQNVQVLCADERGLLSVYFEQTPFISFYKLVRKAGLKLAGLQIEFNREMVRVPALGKTYRVSSMPRKHLQHIYGHLKTFLKRL
jgi:hypothetical protein